MAATVIPTGITNTKSLKRPRTTESPGRLIGAKYIYHDNNRDINYSQVTMRNWLKLYLDWLASAHHSRPA